MGDGSRCPDDMGDGSRCPYILSTVPLLIFVIAAICLAERSYVSFKLITISFLRLQLSLIDKSLIHNPLKYYLKFPLHTFLALTLFRHYFFQLNQ